MGCFNQKEFDEVKICRFCKSKFNDRYDDKTIKLQEICDKEKLKYIIDNNDFDEEVNRIAKLYYNSLDSLGRIIISYRQTDSKDRYYGDSNCLTMLKREIRNSILPLNIKNIDMVNSHPTILLYLCQMGKLKCNILKDYVKNRENILEKFGDNRKLVKERILSLLNGGFKKLLSF